MKMSYLFKFRWLDKTCQRWREQETLKKIPLRDWQGAHRNGRYPLSKIKNKEIDLWIEMY